MKDQDIKQVEADLLARFDQGTLHPLGADGGSLKYVLYGDYETGIMASITLDPDIAKIKRIWQLVIGGKEVYNFTNTYYQLRQ